jgi:rsbT co-antagonist protein RsbR
MAASRSTPAGSFALTQLALFAQILRAVRLAVLLVLGIALLALAFPATRSLPIALLTAITALEWGVTELSIILLRHCQTQRSPLFFVMMTLLLATGVAIVLRASAFIAVITAMVSIMAALLIGARAAVLPGLIGIPLYGLLALSEYLGWRSPIQIPEVTSGILLVRFAFVGAALAVVIVVSTIASGRLHQSVSTAQTRADEAERMRADLADTAAQLTSQLSEQRRLLSVIQELEVQTVRVLPGVLILPLVGQLDDERTERIEQHVLTQVTAQRARLVFVDLTGVPILDTALAQWVLRLSQAIGLLGTQAVLTGLKPATAQQLVHVGITLHGVATYATIQDALEHIDLHSK